MVLEFKADPALPPESCVREDDLPVLAHCRFPVWVFDIDAGRVIWSNEAALDLWAASSQAELGARDMGSEMSSSVRERLLQYQASFVEGAAFDESWTLYPGGQPRTVMCRFRGCVKRDGSMAMLCEAQETGVDDPEILRGSQALLYTGAMVSIYDADGRCFYANPAAHRAFGHALERLQDRIINDRVLRTLRDTLAGGREGRFVSEVRTAAGERIHEIEARRSVDAVSARQALLLTELDITEPVLARRAVDKLANEDMLTGLYNRNFLAAHAAAFIGAARDEGRDIYLLLLDLDRFKIINDTLGHAVGDRLLAEAAVRLRSFFPDETILGRLGGDEFCVLLGADSGPGQIKTMASDLVDHLRRPVQIEGHELRIVASLGLSHAPAEPKRAVLLDNLLKEADLALYEAKGRGGAQVQLYHPELLQRRTRSLLIEDALAQALSGRGGAVLEMRYQPQVCLRHGRITGAEALARLRTRDGQVLMPGEFVLVAETTGLIGDLGAQVLEQVAAAHRRLTDALRDYRLSVNVSPAQLREPALLAQLTRLAARPGVATKRIELELTETEPSPDDGEFTGTLQRIADLGYSIAIDDFGTGYSNIARLGTQPFHRLKIDRSLIRQPGNRLLARGVINMSHAMNIPVMAEGVETADQRDWLVSEGCFAHQGYLYGRPVDFETFCALTEAGIEALNAEKDAP